MPRPLACLSVLLLVLSACTSADDKIAAHLSSARAMMAEENFRQAKLEAKNILQIEPKHAEAHLILAKIAWRDNDVREAVPQLMMAIESDPSLLEARLRLGDILFASGDVQGAAAQAEAARKLDPERADVHVLSAKALSLQGDMKGAEAEIDAALKIDPLLVDAITGKAGMRNAAGDFDSALAIIDDGIKKVKEADVASLLDFRLNFLLVNGRKEPYETSLQELIRDNPDNASYRYQLLDFYTREGRSADQERLLRELMVVDPKNTKIRLRVANMMLMGSDAAGAEALLKEGIAKEPDNAELQLSLGDFYRYRKQSDQAMTTYQQVASKWPETTAEGLRARNRIVAQYVVSGKIAEARAEIDKILKAAPDDPDALLARATFSFFDKQYTEAIADLRTVIRRQTSVEAQLLLARCYVGVGDMVVAKDTYRNVLKNFPNNEAAVKELALLMSSEGETAGATEILRNFIALKPGDAEASAFLVQNLLAGNDISAAEAEAQRIARTSTGNVLTEQAMGSVLQAKGSTAEAVARYKAVLEQDPTQLQALEGLVDGLLELKRPAEAIAYLERYPKSDINASLLLGNVYARQGDMGAAREVYEQAVREKPGEGRLYVALGSLAETDSAEQVAVLQRGLKASPEDMVVPMYLAGIYQRQGKHDEAIGLYESILKKAPNSALVANNLAALLLEYRPDKASLARALELARPFANSDNPLALDTLGWAYYRNGEYENAVRTLETAVGEERNDPLLLYHLGMANLGAGDTEAARQNLGEALKKADSSANFLAEARSALDKLNAEEGRR